MTQIEKDVVCTYQQNLMNVFTRKSVNYGEGLDNQFLILKVSKRKTNLYVQKYRLPRDSSLYYIFHVKNLFSVDPYSAIETPNKRKNKDGEKVYVYLKYTFEVTFSEGLLATAEEVPETLEILKRDFALETPEIVLDKYYAQLESMREEAKARYCETMNINYDR